MPGDISRSYKGPKDGRVPSWMEDDYPEQHDAHVLAFRWHQRMWMEREYRRGGERLS